MKNTPDKEKGQLSAEVIVELEREIKPYQERIDEEKQFLREYFPDEKFTTEDGSTVSVGKETFDRQTGTKIEFNEFKYAELDSEMKAALDRLGVVRIVPKMTKGQKPKITVKLND